ncbi:MAG: deoxyribonuclease V [Chloroflexota bacterium]
MFDWDGSPASAIALQRQLASRVIRENRWSRITTVAGVDVSIRGDMGRAAGVVLSYPALAVVDYTVAARPVDRPYVPGLLSFREGPLILAALERLATRPDVLIIDGHGLAHPRRLGIASHIGVLLDLPTIGCAKSRLCGRYQEPGLARGSWEPLLDGAEVIGAVLRTRAGVRPIFVSIGHRVDLPASIEVVLNCCRGYRLPETSRWAHRLAGGEKPAVTA